MIKFKIKKLKMLSDDSLLKLNFLARMYLKNDINSFINELFKEYMDDLNCSGPADQDFIEFCDYCKKNNLI